MKKPSAIGRKRRAMRASRLPIKTEHALDREQIRQLIREELQKLVGNLRFSTRGDR